MDLGAAGWESFRYVTLPSIRSALLAGGLVAFGLSFDEIIVTKYLAGTTGTLPIFIYRNLSRPTNKPIVNVVALVVGVLSILPVYLALRFAGEGGIGPTARSSRA